VEFPITSNRIAVKSGKHERDLEIYFIIIIIIIRLAIKVDRRRFFTCEVIGPVCQTVTVSQGK